jgi:TonB-linked SusC/RagA family outer membrane protein
VRYKLGLLVALILAAFAASPAHAQERTIRGTVVDSISAQPVANPNVVVLNTRIGVLGEGNGTFVLSGVPAGPVTLVVSRIGYRSRQVQVPAGVNEINVKLFTDYLQVQELVVTGKATAVARQNLANAVSTVSGASMNEIPQETVDEAMVGKVAGATISANSGAPGGGLQIQSINASADPLIVIDGQIVSNAAIPSDANVVTNAAGGQNPSLVQDNQVNRIADLNPEDIESIEVLKGASAAAIYGGKASNGVIIITTKHGTAGQPRMRLSGELGTYSLSNTIGSRRFTSAQEAQDATGLGAVYTANGGAFYDHEKELAGHHYPSWQGSASVSGGTPTTSYFGSLLAKKDKGIVENTGYDKQSGRVNLTQKFGSLFNISFNTALMRTWSNRGLTNNDNSQTSYYMVLSATPSFVPLMDSNGDYVPNVAVGNGSNPLQTAALLKNDETVWHMLGSTNAELDPILTDNSSLKILFNGGVDWFEQTNDVFSPPSLFFEPTDGLPGTEVLSKSNNLALTAQANAVYKYTPTSGSFTSTTSLGGSYSSTDQNIDRTISQNLNGGLRKVDAGTVKDVRQNRIKVEDFGFYLQEELLAMDQRLLLSAAIRGDQSGANGDPSHVYFYPKAAASFRFPDLGGPFDEIKLRAAFGQTGNEPQFNQKFTTLLVTQNIEGLPGFTLQGDVGDANIKPERQTEFEGGADITGLDGRATLSLTGYVQTINDLILQRRVAPSTGFRNEFFNGGQLRTWGGEASLGITPVATSNFSWVSRTNFSFNRSRIEKLPVPAFIPSNAGFGTSLGAFYIEQGKSATQIVGTAGTNPDGSAKLVSLGNSVPDFEVSFSNELRYSGLRLYGLLDWRKGQDVVNLTQLLYDAFAISPDYQPPDNNVRPVTECFPDCYGLERLLGYAGGFARGYTQSASFLKLREVSLSYELPESAVHSLFGGAFRSVTFRASGRDLLTFTPYKGLDPEVSNFGNQQVGRNIDVAPYPPSRSFWFGVDLGI